MKLQATGCQHVSLLQKRIALEQGFGMFNESRLGTQPIQETPISNSESALEVAQQHRMLQGIPPEQELMVALAFSSPVETKRFRLFHAVVHVDSTSHTNKEARPLVLVTTKDSRGKMVTVLNAFLPCEQAWAYQWLFGSVFPLILGPEMLGRVQLVVTDGDAQETSQLDLALQEVFPNADGRDAIGM